VVQAVMLKAANLDDVGFELTMLALFVAALHRPTRRCPFGRRRPS
jgi:hypothetical protein